MKKKINPEYINLCCWVILILWMSLIFMLSAQNGTKSDSLSGKTIRITAQTADQEFKKLPSENQDAIVAHWQNLARKSAHVLLYFALGILCILLLLQYPMKMNRRFWIALFIALIYAVSDEIHQMYVGGRNGSILDICIDTAGALLGIWLVIKLYRIWFKYRQTD